MNRHIIYKVFSDLESSSGSIREREQVSVQTLLCDRLRDVIIGTETVFKPAKMIS